MHDCPAAPYAEETASGTTLSRSASSSTMNGPLPPSSMSWALPAARAATRCPVATEPVKATTWTSGCPVRASPTTAPAPVTRFTTPGGKPAASKHLIHSCSISVVEGAGSATTVLPVTSAGASWPDAVPRGKFQGWIVATTPRGTR